MRHRLIALLAGLMVLGIAGTALAAPSVDTVLVQGYDADEMRLIFGVSGIWEDGDEPGTELDCKLVGSFVYELTDDDVTGLYENTGTNEAPTQGDEADFGYEDDSGSDDRVPYGQMTVPSTPDALECWLTAVDVRGPNDQVNHGTIQSSLIHALKALGLKGMGCLTSQFSKLGYGKGDEQIKVGDEVPPTDPTALLAVDLESLEGACDKGNKKGADWQPPGQAKKGEGWEPPGQAKKDS